MTELQNYISSHFAISKEELYQIENLFTTAEIKKGDYFLKTGQYCQKLSFIQSGFLRVYAKSGDKYVTQWISSKGFFVTDLHSFIFKQRARWHIQALTDCKLYTIEKENYERLNTTIPNWSTIEKRFISSCFVMLENRVFSHLSLSAEERYYKLFNENKDLFNKVPLQYIASMLGMSPETFSRIRRNVNS